MKEFYIVGFRKDTGLTEFEYPKPTKQKVSFAKVKEKKVPPTKYFLSTQYVQTLVNHKARHEGKGNGFGYAIIPDDGHCKRNSGRWYGTRKKFGLRP